MREQSEISQQVAFEGERRQKLGVPAVAGGVLYLISGVIISSTLGGAPTVGVLQGLTPALNGETNPLVSPRAAEIRFQSHHSFGLIAGSVLAGLAIAAFALVLVFLLDATRFRRPETNRVARWMLIVGGAAVAVLGVANEVILAIKAHQFATGHDFSNHAVDAVTHSTAYNVLALVAPITAIVLVAGIVITMMSAVRVGLLPRWIGMIGGLSAVLLLLPAPSLNVVPAFWMVSIGILLMGKLPKGDPAAWAAGEARPWPTRAELRAQGEAAAAGTGKGTPALSAAAAVPAPEPAPATAGSSRRRRKRGSRR